MKGQAAVLERRIEVLEQALEMQAVLIGRCLEMAAGKDCAMMDWLGELVRDIRTHPPLEPTAKRIMDGLLRGAVLPFPAELQQLRDLP